MEHLKEIGIVVYLKAEFATINEGCPISKDVVLQLKKDRHLKTYMMKDAYYTKNMQI